MAPLCSQTFPPLNANFQNYTVQLAMVVILFQLAPNKTTCGCTFNHISIITTAESYLFDKRLENYIFLCWWLNRFMQIHNYTSFAGGRIVRHPPWIHMSKTNDDRQRDFRQVTTPLRQPDVSFVWHKAAKPGIAFAVWQLSPVESLC